MNKRLPLLLVLGLCSAAPQADTIPVTWTLLSDANPGAPFAGRWAGPDLLWGTGDEADAPGRNAAGHASTFRDDSGAFEGYEGGSFSTALDTLTFDYTFTSSDILTEFSCAVCQPPLFDVQSTSMLSTTSGGTNGGGLLPDGRFSVSFDVVNDFGDTFRATGTTVLFGNGGPTAATVDAAVLAHFATVSPWLPANWASALVMQLDFEVIDGPNLGFAGTQVLTAYDVAPVPVPAALPLIASALAGVAAVGRRRSARQG